MLGNVYVVFCGFSRFLLKRVDYENRFGKFGYVKHPMLKFAMDAQFHNTGANARHGLPIARFQTDLHEMDFMPCTAPGFRWKGSKVLKRGP